MSQAQSSSNAAGGPAHEAPAVSSAWYRSLFDHGRTGILLIDTETDQVVAANPEACRLLGYSEGALCALQRAAIVDRTALHLAAALETREDTGDWRGESTYRRADGTVFPVEVSSSVFCGPDDRPVEGVFFWDISARRSTEEVRREREERLRFAMDAASEGLWDWNIVTGEVVSNDRGFTLFGYDPEETPHPSNVWFKSLHPDDAAEALRALHDYVEGRSSAYDSAHRIITKSGEIRWIQNFGKIVAWDADGKPTRMVGTNADITDRKVAEQRLRDSEERFRLVVENSPDVVTIWGREGDIQYVSPAVEQILGLTAAEVERRHRLAPSGLGLRPATKLDVEQWAAPDADPEETDSWLKIMGAVQACAENPGQKLRLEFRLRTAAGAYRDLAVVYQGFMHSSHGAEVVSIARDITEHRTLERVLQEANADLEQRVVVRTAELAYALEELKKAAQLKDEFLATVSHELRTPLTGVLGMAEALELQFSGPLNERQLRYVHTIRESGNQLLSLVNSILRYTELLGNRVVIHREPCRLAELATIAVRAVRRYVEQKGQTVEFDIDPIDLLIYSDTNGIIQVLQQLLDNAVKFTPDRGQIGLDVRSDDARGCVSMAVWDTGIGISAEQQAIIFEPFVQGDASLARRYGGLGLGLAYVRRMVELMGGTIAVESALGKGSRFTVTLRLR